MSTTTQVPSQLMYSPATGFRAHKPAPLRLQPYVDAAGGHRWRMRARNGRIVASSGEAYSSRRALDKAMARLAGAVVVIEAVRA